MSGLDIAAEIAGAIAEAGAATGDGSPLVATLLRPAAGGTPDYSQPIGAQAGGANAEHACTVVISNYTARDRDGTNIQAGDVKLLVSTEGLTVVPKNSDKIRVSGQTYSIVDVTELAPGGVAVMWTVQARRS